MWNKFCYSESNLILSFLLTGICYGMQIIAKEFGGEVGKKDIREDGPTEVKIDSTCPLFA